MEQLDKLYLLFGNAYHESNGGWEDFIGRFDTQDAAIRVITKLKEAKKSYIQWWHIVDLNTEEVIEDSFNYSEAKDN